MAKTSCVVPAAETLFGCGAAEVLGGSLDRIIPERFWRAHWDGFNQALGTGQTKYTNRTLATRSVGKNGGELHVDLSFSVVRDHAGLVIGALAIVRQPGG
jgi:PAS domain S-box-containing protein